MLVAASAEARITKFVVDTTRSQSPTFGGFSFPGVGQYEKVVGTAFGELDPADPKNAVIVDIALAQRNANGKVPYSFDFYILKPIDLSKGNQKIFYEAPNRGGKQFGSLNRSAGGNDPGTTTNPGQTFFAPRGYTMVWSGWDQAAGTNNANFNTTISLPVAKNADGTSITGPVYEYIENDNATTTSSALTYTPNSLTGAQLTRKAHLNDVPVVIPTTGWAYNATTNSISLLPAGTAFNQGDIYEFTYTAKDPTVNAVGFAALRDFGTFLRYAAKDDAGVVNPFAGNVCADLHVRLIAADADLERFRLAGLQPGRNRAEGVRRHAELDWRRRWHQHESPFLATGPYGAEPPAPSCIAKVSSRSRRRR